MNSTVWYKYNRIRILINYGISNTDSNRYNKLIKLKKQLIAVMVLESNLESVFDV